MESKWNQIINSRQQDIDDKYYPSDNHPVVEKVKREDEKDENHVVHETNAFYDHQLPPDSPMYLPQLQQPRQQLSETQTQLQNKVEKRYRYNPKPLGRKINRTFVPEDRKTEEYWQRRIKNNVAARKSREDRRKTEIETLNKKSHYERENLQLQMFIEKVENENQHLVLEINALREGKLYQRF